MHFVRLILFLSFQALATATLSHKHSVPSITTAPASCHADCSIFTAVTSWEWTQGAVSTVTAATVVHIINNRTNATTTSTIFNDLPPGSNPFPIVINGTSTIFYDLPPGQTPPPTNSEGSQTAIITLQTAEGKYVTYTLTFPTGIGQEGVDYTWEGVLPTVNPAGQSVCSTGSAVIPLSSTGFTYFDVTTAPSDDPGGLLWQLSSGICAMSIVRTINTNDAALMLCSDPVEVCGVEGMNVATILTVTETSTSFIDSAHSAETEQSKSFSATASVNPASTVTGMTSTVVQSVKSTASTTPAAAPASQPAPNTPTSTEGASRSETAAVTPSPLVISNPTYSASAVTSAGGTSTVYNIGGQTLGVGSSIVVGCGPSAIIIVLQTNTDGNTQVVVNWKSSNIPTTTPNGQSVGPAILSGISGIPTAASPSSVAMVSVNGGRREEVGIGLIVHMAFVALVMGFAIIA